MWPSAKKFGAPLSIAFCKHANSKMLLIVLLTFLVTAIVAYFENFCSSKMFYKRKFELLSPSSSQHKEGNSSRLWHNLLMLLRFLPICSSG